MNRERLIQTGLLVSVGLNLFLLGAMVPAWLGHGRDPGNETARPTAWRPFLPLAGNPEGIGHPFINRIADRLPPADAAIVREQFDLRMKAAVDRMQSFRQRIDRARTLMKAEPFDADALRAELREASAKRQSVDEEQLDAMVTLLTKLSPEGRRILAELRPGPGVFGGQPGGIPIGPGAGPILQPPPPPDRP